MRLAKISQSQRDHRGKSWRASGHRLEGTPLILARLKVLFNREGVPYRIIPHGEAYTASELAESIHVPGRKVVKVVIVKSFGEQAMVVLPSHQQIDLKRFSEVMGKREVTLVNEAVMSRRFPDCEAGAMPPFGGFYGFPVYCEASLAHEPVIFFSAGTHRVVVEMRYQDYSHIVLPTVGHFVQETLKNASGF
jgi:Ala-tRNA(Pro) deacylase